jgi:glycosyltransferase involved in cell wall biosynthesis
MAEGIASALRYPSLARALSENGRAEVAGLRWSGAARRIEAVYAEVVWAR